VIPVAATRLAQTPCWGTGDPVAGRAAPFLDPSRARANSARSSGVSEAAYLRRASRTRSSCIARSPPHGSAARRTRQTPASAPARTGFTEKGYQTPEHAGGWQPQPAFRRMSGKEGVERHLADPDGVRQRRRRACGNLDAKETRHGDE